ncbi:MAG: GTPase Era [Treponema sp.]|jgi:GTP-binding protein Era|nr:GTPase Era [Treponema sp.]
MPPFNQKKAAFVAVVGRPSVGKSTLVNRICGGKVAIVSPVPQTTRRAVRGIFNSDEGQLVFVDTPGRHASEKKFNRRLMEVSDRSIAESDLVLYMLDASRPPGSEEDAVAGLLQGLPESGGKLAAAVNKIDAPGADTGKAQAFLAEKLPRLEPERIFAVSALKNEGIPALLSCLFSMAAPGEPFYPEDIYTDQDVRFRVAEIVREKAMLRLREELPHSVYVDVADAELRDGGKRLWVRAFIMVERESQKGMVIGKGGELVRAIRIAAEKDLARIFEWKIDLDIRVKTSRDWRHSDAVLKRIFER